MAVLIRGTRWKETLGILDGATKNAMSACSNHGEKEAEMATHEIGTTRNLAGKALRMLCALALVTMLMPMVPTARGEAYASNLTMPTKGSDPYYIDQTGRFLTGGIFEREYLSWKYTFTATGDQPGDTLTYTLIDEEYPNGYTWGFFDDADSNFRWRAVIAYGEPGGPATIVASGGTMHNNVHKMPVGDQVIEYTLDESDAGRTFYACIYSEDLGGYLCERSNTSFLGDFNLHTVTFEDWDGTVLKTEQVVAGEVATAPENPAREDCAFAGWDKSFDCVEDDMTVTAIYHVLSIEVNEGPCVFDGTELEPEVEVSLDGAPVEDGYEIAYSDNLHAGTATVKASYKTGAGTCVARTTFDIEKAHATNVLAEAAEESFIYDGEPHVPEVVASIDGNVLDGLVCSAPDDVVNAGEKTITVTCPDFDGIATASYRIEPAELNALELAKTTTTFNSKPQKPTVSMVSANSRPVPASDYTLSYYRSGKATGDFKSAGRLTVEATATSPNYTGSTSATCTIAKASPVITAKATSRKVRASATKKKAHSLSMGVKTTLGGKLSYSVVKKSRFITFKHGKATLKKGAKPGVHSIKVKAVTKATGNLKATSKTFTLTFLVRR